MFTEEEVQLLLSLIKEKHCPRGGYSDDPKIAGLQHKLSIHLEMAHRRALNDTGGGPRGEG